MNKEFILKSYKTPQFYMVFLALYFQIKFIWGMLTVKNFPLSWGFYAIFAFLIVQIILWISCVAIKVYIDDDFLIIKRPLFVFKIRRSDIKSVKLTYVGAPGYVYYIHTDKKKYWLPDNLEHMSELLKLLKN